MSTAAIKQALAKAYALGQLFAQYQAEGKAESAADASERMDKLLEQFDEVECVRVVHWVSGPGDD